MANAKWPAMTTPKGAKLDNERSHGHPDANGGGGPSLRRRQMIPPAQRGGVGAKQSSPSSLPHGGRPTHPLPTPGFRAVGRQSTPSETRNPGHGGAVAERAALHSLPHRGGVGTDGQRGLPTEGSGPYRPGAGNTAGRSHKLIAGHFTHKAKGTGVAGKYGDRMSALESV